MADVTVPLLAYIDGPLPDVCVVTGEPTSARFTHVTEVLPVGSTARMLARVERLLSAPPQFGKVLVVHGSIPLSLDIDSHFRRTRRAGATGLAISFLALIAAAWSGTGAAPILAGAATIAVAVSAWVYRTRVRRLPRVAVDQGADTVTLRGVHEAFASALEVGTG